MKRYLLLPLLLAACSQSPEERYYSLNGAITVTARAAEAYVDDCKAKPAENPCHEKLPKIRDGAKTLKTALAQSDRVFVTKDSQFYSLSQTVVENALKNLQALLEAK